MKKRAFPFRPIFFLISAAGFVWFLIPIGWHVLNIGNGSGLGVCLLLMAISLFWERIRDACRRSKRLHGIFAAAIVLLCAGAAWSAAMTACMFSVASAAPPENATVVVLGSMVYGKSPSADLLARIRTASKYLKAHPGTKCIASGGQGPHEGMAEASAIKKSLVSDGIDPARILTEEDSFSTKENLANTMELISRRSLSRRLAIVTDDYHEFRACSIARKLNAEPYAVPAKTPWYIFPACWAREVLALTKYLLLPG